MWRRVFGIFCCRRVSDALKDKVYKTEVRIGLPYGLETAALTQKQDAELEVAEQKILRFYLGVTKMDMIKNKHIRGTARVGCLGGKVKEAEVRWFENTKCVCVCVWG